MTTTEHYHCTYTNSYAVAYPGGVLWVLQHPPCATASTYKLGLVCYIRNTNQRLLRAVTVPHSLRVREGPKESVMPHSQRLKRTVLAN